MTQHNYQKSWEETNWQQNNREKEDLFTEYMEAKYLEMCDIQISGFMWHKELHESYYQKNVNILSIGIIIAA